MSSNQLDKSEKQDLGLLKEFVSTTMSTTANYQPVIIRELLLRGGKATKDELALALLLEQPRVLDYWRKILMKWPYGTLHKKHGVVNYSPKKKEFSLPFDLTSEDLVTELVQMCEARIRTVRLASKSIESSLRAKLIEGAKGCCEACGAKASGDGPLDIDHIIPQSKAKDGKVKTASGEIIGVHDLQNLQVLCIACNRGKREHGDFDYRPSMERLVEAVVGIIKRASDLEMDVDEILATALNEVSNP